MLAGHLGVPAFFPIPNYFFTALTMMSSDCSSLPAELRRMHALTELDLLDTPPSEAFDRITRLAARLFDLPSAAVSLTDSHRQWFKSRVGVARTQIPRSPTPCALVTESEKVLVVEDMRLHPDLCNSLLASDGVRFYAGAPLMTREGYCLGAMCVLGSEPRVVAEHELAMLEDMAAMVMAQIELQHALGRLDAHSRLPNRVQFQEDFDDLCHDSPHGTRRLALMLNLASPEQLDDAVRVLGAAYLDEIQAEAASWLRAHVAPAARIYHVGPTQFAWVGAADGDETMLVESLRGVLSRHASSSTRRFVTTATFGLAPFFTGQDACLDVLRWCHSAAREAIELPARVSVFDPHQDLVYKRRFTLISEFGAALERDDQLSLVFQPRIDLASGRCIGAEALLRWNHPVLGPVSPGEFMPVIEQTSMVRATTFWVVNTALAQLAAWQGAGIAITVSVNVSPANLVEPEFAEWLIGAVARRGLQPGSLELEITESAVLENQKQATAVLTKIAAAGIGLAIDDFGTGYSSLSYLQNLPADVVKIDQSFIRSMLSDARTDVLVATMIGMSHALGYRVVAEGVETQDELARLVALECDEVQGYLLARPMPPAAIPAWISEHGVHVSARYAGADANQAMQRMQ
jgi:EAL domain-containing protein (putative c-di-GMP-specific phosphodiesterase class I)/GGDEF domain-containing protein